MYWFVPGIRKRSLFSISGVVVFVSRWMVFVSFLRHSPSLFPEGNLVILLLKYSCSTCIRSSAYYSVVVVVLPLYDPARYTIHDAMCEHRVMSEIFSIMACRACAEKEQVAGEMSMGPGAVSGCCEGIHKGVADARYLPIYLPRRARRNLCFDAPIGDRPPMASLELLGTT